MTTRTIALIAALLPSLALADGPTAGFDDPHIYGDVPNTTSWDGFYAGGAVGWAETRRTVSGINTKKTTETETIGCPEEGDCDVTVPDHLRGNDMVNALPHKREGGCQNATADCITRTDENGNAKRLWLTGPMEVETGSKNIAQAFYDGETTGDFVGGVFAGWRGAVAENFYLGGEAGYLNGASGFDDLFTLEGTAGLSAGRMLFSVSGGYANLEGHNGWAAGAGADYRLKNNWSLGTKAFYAEAGNVETAGVLLRLSKQF